MRIELRPNKKAFVCAVLIVSYALAVLDSNGKLLFSQPQGEFESARSLAPEDLSAFLIKWKETR